MTTQTDVSILKQANYQVVTARCNEDMTWAIDGIKQGILEAEKFVIMNKGDLNTLPQQLQSQSVPVPNIGLDQYCHLRYIVDNYDILPDVVVFIQAGMNEHHDIYEPHYSMQNIKILDNMPKYNLKLSTSDVLLGMIKQVLLYGTTLNNKTYITRNGYMCAYDELTMKTDDEDVVTDGTFKEWFVTNVRTSFPPNEIFMWFKNAIFGVSKRYILSQPKSYYETIMSQITTRRAEILHFIERSWFYMLNMDRRMEPHGLLATLVNHASIFQTLDDIIVESGTTNVEGSLMFTGYHDMKYNEEFVHKKVNLFNFAKKANTILEIGFNAGHSTALMLLANPHSKVLLFDLQEHVYVQRCLTFLKSVFGKERFIDFVPGNSKQTVPSYLISHPSLRGSFDLLHIDGGQDDLVVLSDISNCQGYSKDDEHVVVIDDYNINNIQRIVDQFVRRCFVKPIENVLLDTYCGQLYHYVGKYS